MNRTVKGRKHHVSDRNGNRRFANPTRSDDGHEAATGQLFRNSLDGFVASDQVRGKGWKRLRLAWAGCLRLRVGRRVRTRNRRYEAVTSTRNVGHIPGAFSAVPKRFAQRRDMESEAALVNIDVGPYSGNEIPFADDFSGAFDEENENIQCAPSDLHGNAISLEQSFRREQSKDTK